MITWRVNADRGGFTLIEILIAVAIGSVVMAGAVGVFRSQRVAYDLMNQMKLMEENGRVGMDMMAREMRIANGGTPLVSRDNVLSPSYAARQAALGAKAGTDIVEVFTGLLRESVCLPNLTVVADGTLTAQSTAFAGALGTLGQYSALMYSPSDNTKNCSQKITNIATIGGVTTVSYLAGTNIDSSGRGHSCAEFLPTAIPLITDTCLNIGADVYYYVNTSNQLIRYVVGGATEVIANYVEDFQLKYGEDNTANATCANLGDNVIQTGEWVHTPTCANRVRIAKIALLMRSKSVDPNKTAALAPVLENSTVAFGVADKYRRRVFTRTVRLRNMEVN